MFWLYFWRVYHSKHIRDNSIIDFNASGTCFIQCSKILLYTDNLFIRGYIVFVTQVMKHLTFKMTVCVRYEGFGEMDAI